MRVSPLAVAALLALPCVAAADTRLSLPMQPAMGPAVATGPDGRGLAAWFSCATPGTWYLCTLQAATLQGVRWGPTQNLAAPELFIPEEGPATAIGGRGVAGPGPGPQHDGSRDQRPHAQRPVQPLASRRSHRRPHPTR